MPSWTHSYIRGPSGVADWGVIIMVGGPPVLDKYPILETGTLEHSRNRLRFVCRLYLTFKKIYNITVQNKEETCKLRTAKRYEIILVSVTFLTRATVQRGIGVLLVRKTHDSDIFQIYCCRTVW